MSRFVTYTVYLLCSGLNNEDERQGAPLTETLWKCASSRFAGGGRNEETPATENERAVLMPRACARTLSSRSFLLLEHSLPYTQPALWTGPMSPAWRLLHVSRIAIPDLT